MGLQLVQAEEGVHALAGDVHEGVARGVHQEQVALRVQLVHDGVVDRLVVERLAPARRGPGDDEPLVQAQDFQRAGRVHLLGHLHAADQPAQPEHLAGVQGVEGQGREADPGQDAEQGQAPAAHALAAPGDVDQGGQTEQDRGHGAQECEGSDQGQGRAGQGQATGPQGLVAPRRGLEGMPTLGAGDLLARQGVLRPEAGAAGA